MKKILLTGGHAGTTALSVIEVMKEMHESWAIFWCGPKYSMEGSDKKTLEFRIFPKKDVTCVPITTGRLQRKWTRYTLLSILKIPVGFLHAILIMSRVKPDVVLSFGGFAGFPVVIAAWMYGIPTVLHEQTVAVGLANKLSSHFVNLVTLASSTSKSFFEGNEVRVVGNPILSSIKKIGRKQISRKDPVIFLTGGSRGARRINSIFEKITTTFLKDSKIIHQTGDIDYSHFHALRETFTDNMKKRYEIVSFIDPLMMGEMYKRADIVIARAGANTVHELIYLSKPSILIPIPWTRYNEQTKNAQLAQKVGVSIMIKESELTESVLESTIKELLKRPVKVSKLQKEIHDLDENASQSLVNILEKFV